jgi:gamma-glutamylcyclotransferase (GGCT)/AIG2-like uncharacterized protein YtfP
MKALPPYADLPDAGHLLFAYGTLMLTTGIAAVDEAMRNAGTSLGRGWIHGLLFDLGEYPGAVEVRPDPDQRDEDAPKVWGHLLRLTDPAALFSVIDAYEGFEPAHPGRSEFVRAETRVFLPGRAQGIDPGIDPGIRCQVYWYNFPISGRSAIGSGDYLAYWHAKGNPAQGRAAGDFGR